MSVLNSVLPVIVYYVFSLLLVCAIGILYCIIVHLVLEKRLMHEAETFEEMERIDDVVDVAETCDSADAQIAHTSLSGDSSMVEKKHVPFDKAAVLKNLEELKNRGFISDAEYEMKRESLLG